MPADMADIAQDFTEAALESSLQKRKTLTVPFSGFCLACGESVGERRYCNSDCRETHEQEMRRKTRLG